ncbi:hypothetical protein ACHQM5_013647 [Ranunculus cassubicifolius]
MPTPVTIARQCLTPEASTSLDDAVNVARRRSHSQTTSLHVISAFLSLPSSSLRDACARVRSSAYAPRYQFKALELCFSSALDRLPSSQSLEEPPISNSLMAAIKRSQANQRRNPESFHLYQQQQQMLQQQQQQQIQQQSSLNCIKVELQQLILSILDDPIVSRVFGEAGFRSCDIKLAILRPLPPLGRYQRSRRAPLFLCNLTEENSDLGRSNFNFPFAGFVEANEIDENLKRIWEILGKKKERNPLLVGVSANEALHSFQEIIERNKVGVLPMELCGLSFFCIEKEISRFVLESGSEGLVLSTKFEELDQLIQNCCGPGVVLSFGDLIVLLDDNSVDAVSYVVSQVSRLLEVHQGKLWLIGAAAKYEMYLKFLMRFPSIEKDWDLQLLPITSLKSQLGGFPSPRPQSLTESFVPFGGFFSTTADLRNPLTSTDESISRCHLCNEKCELEISSFLNGGYTPSVSDQYNEGLSSWLQKAELNTSKGLDMTKAKDDGAVFNAKVTGLQNKWNDICRRLHHISQTSKEDNYHAGPLVVPHSTGLSFLSDRKDDLGRSSKIFGIPNTSECGNSQPTMPPWLHKISSPTPKSPTPVISEGENENSASERHARESKSECHRTDSLQYPPGPLSNSSIGNDHASPSPTTSVGTDLGLGTLYSSTQKEPKNLTVQTNRDWLLESSDCSPGKVDVFKPKTLNPSIHSPSCSGPDSCGQVDPNDLKSLWRFLLGKVGRQNEAMQTISQTITRCRTGTERRRGTSLKRDVWFNFIGLDRVAKRRTAFALAEILFGSKQNIISLDLSTQDGITRSDTIFGCLEMNGYDEKFRGKMVVDYIAEEISKNPLSIVLLENINKADMLLQNSLSQAIKTGKFSNSRGRETSINNTIFIATSTVVKETKALSFENICTKFSEEKVLAAQGLEMQILVVSSHETSSPKSNSSNVLVTTKKETPGPSKRKLVDSNGVTEQREMHDWLERAPKTPKYLDLNLPSEDTEAISSDNDSTESDSISENSEIWLEEFLSQMDGTAVFKPFDFDALANKLLKDISVVLRNTVGPECSLEIDTKVMEQILAAAWLSDKKRAMEDWVEQILGRAFAEARQRHSLSGQSVLKLVTSDDLYVKDQASGICLPSRIVLN